jgi:hypothetical protein
LIFSSLRKKKDKWIEPQRCGEHHKILQSGSHRRKRGKEYKEYMKK